jgi:hypothetical protein
MRKDIRLNLNILPVPVHPNVGIVRSYKAEIGYYGILPHDLT